MVFFHFSSKKEKNTLSDAVARRVPVESKAIH